MTVALDLETTSLDPHRGSILAVGLAAGSKVWAGTVTTPLDLRRIRDVLVQARRPQAQDTGQLPPPGTPTWPKGDQGASTPSVEEPTVGEPGVLIVHHAPMELGWAKEFFGLSIDPERVRDTFLMAHRVAPGQAASLDSLVAKYLPDLAGYKIHTQGQIAEAWKIPPETLVRRVAMDAYTTRRLYDILLPRISENGRKYLGEDVALAMVVHEIEKKGLYFDEEKAVLERKKLEAEQAEIVRALRDSLGRPDFNPGSSVQVGDVLQGFGESLVLSDKGNPQTGEIPLRALAHDTDNPATRGFVEQVLGYRERQKLLGTYIGGYAKRRSPDGRLRSRLRFPGAVSWRLSSSDPNLQNVPRKGLRHLFRAPPGYALLEGDYSQIELRIAAVLSKDPAFCKVFAEGGDPHGLLAHALFGTGFSSEQRHLAKTTNFGTIYGASYRTLWRQFVKDGIFLPMKEIARFHRVFWSIHPDLQTYMLEQRQRAQAGETLCGPTAGYEWRLADVANVQAEDEEDAVLSIVNATIQSVPPRLTLRAARRALAEGIDIVLQTHDGLMAYVPLDILVDVGRRLRTIMAEEASEPWWGGIPCPAVIKSGPSWGELKEIAL